MDSKKYEHQILVDLKRRVNERVQASVESRWSFLKTLRQPEGKLLLAYIRPKARALAAMGGLSMISTALEGLRLLFLLITLQLIVGEAGGTGTSTSLLGFSLDLPFVSELSGTSGIAIALGGLAVLTALREGSDLALNSLSYRVQGHFMYEVRRDLLDKLLSLEPAYFTDTKSGDLAYLQNTIVNRFASLFPALRTALQAALDLVVSVAFLALISPQLTLLLLGLSAVFIAVVGMLRHRTRRLSFESEEASRESATHFLELVHGIRLVKLLGTQGETVRKRYLGLSWDAVRAMTRQGVYGGVTGAIGRVGSAISLVLLAIGLTVAGDFGPDSNAGTALGFLAISMRAVDNVRLLTDARLRLSTMVPHYLMIAEFILDDRYLEASARSSLPALPRIEKEVAVSNLSFEYEPGHPVLDDVSVNFGMGTTTAIIGPSGSGKTTLMEILAGYRIAQEQQIQIDGRALGDHNLDSYRGQVGYVTQDTVIFHDTIRENISFLNRNADDQQIARALQLAAADDFVFEDGRGLDSVLGERGLKISGGQRQRIALARMFLQDPPLFLLDEATSGLDLYTEARLFASMMELREKKIIVVVAHRLSSISHFDKIVVLHRGKLVEQGTHDELLERRGLYFHLWGLQEYAPEASLASLASL